MAFFSRTKSPASLGLPAQRSITTTLRAVTEYPWIYVTPDAQTRELAAGVFICKLPMTALPAQDNPLLKLQQAGIAFTTPLRARYEDVAVAIVEASAVAAYKERMELKAKEVQAPALPVTASAPPPELAHADFTDTVPLLDDIDMIPLCLNRLTKLDWPANSDSRSDTLFSARVPNDRVETITALLGTCPVKCATAASGAGYTTISFSLSAEGTAAKDTPEGLLRETAQTLEKIVIMRERRLERATKTTAPSPARG